MGSVRIMFIRFSTILFRGSYNETAHAMHANKPTVCISLPAVGVLLLQVLITLCGFYCETQQVFHPHLHHNAIHLMLPGFDCKLKFRNLSQIKHSKKWVLTK